MNYNKKDIENYFLNFIKDSRYFFTKTIDIKFTDKLDFHKDILLFNFNGSCVRGMILNESIYYIHSKYVIEILKNEFNHTNENICFLANVGHEGGDNHIYYFYDYNEQCLIIGKRAPQSYGSDVTILINNILNFNQLDNYFIIK